MSGKPEDFEPPGEQVEEENRIRLEVLRLAEISHSDAVFEDANDWFDRCKPRKWIEVDPWEEDFILSMVAGDGEESPPLQYRPRREVTVREDGWHVWTSEDRRSIDRKAFRRDVIAKAKRKARELHKLLEQVPTYVKTTPDDSLTYRTAKQWLRDLAKGALERQWPESSREERVERDGFDFQSLMQLQTHPTFRHLWDWLDLLALHHALGGGPKTKTWWADRGLMIANELYLFLHADEPQEMGHGRFDNLWTQPHPYYRAECERYQKFFGQNPAL